MRNEIKITHSDMVGYFSGFFTIDSSSLEFDCGRFCGYFCRCLPETLSDLILGLHDTVFFTYGAILICAGLGLRFLKNPSAGSVVTLSLISSLVFFAVSNFGVWWAQDIYPHNAQGLLTCFIMGLPFFRGQILGDLLYSGVLFGAYAWLAQKAQQTA
jgi:hypothetical protein